MLKSPRMVFNSSVSVFITMFVFVPERYFSQKSVDILSYRTHEEDGAFHICHTLLYRGCFWFENSLGPFDVALTDAIRTPGSGLHNCVGSHFSVEYSVKCR